jgi:hypothetical protein
MLRRLVRRLLELLRTLEDEEEEVEGTVVVGGQEKHERINTV